MVDKYQYFNGLKFTRDEKSGYYLNSTNHIRMHRYVWKFYNGDIPIGFHIHHIDGDKSNNIIDNLEMLEKNKHEDLHGKLLSNEDREWRRDNIKVNAMPKAKAWHASQEGKVWHKKQYEKTRDKLLIPQKYTCKQCGSEFISTQVNSKFCSNKCKSIWRRAAGIDNVTKRCFCCGGEYTANKYSKTKYCSLCKNKKHPRNRKSRRL